jgi:hypothetical protein
MCIGCYVRTMNIGCSRKKNNNIKSKGRRQEEKGRNKKSVVLYEKFSYL